MFNSTEDAVTAAAWMKGIGLSVAASVIGGASKLAIRKSWLLEQEEEDENDENDVLLPPVTTTTTTGGIFFGSSDETRAYALILPPHRSHLKTEDTATTTGTEDDALDTSDHVMEGLRLESQHSSGAPSEPESTILPTSKNWLPVALRCSGMIGMTFLNPLCCVLAMNYASPSILAPFSGLTLVWIVLLSSPLINEQPSHRQVSAAALIVLGEVVVAIFGDHTNGEGVTVSDVQKSYLRPPFLVYIALATAWFLVLARLMLRSKSAALRRFAWGVSGGCLTGFQNFLKDSLTIVTATNSSIDATMPWGLLGFFVFMAVLTSFLGLLLLTACMKRYDATYSAAMFVGSFVVSASIMSAVHYDTFGHLEGTINWICYPAGLAILMSGVYMLITEDPTEEGEEDIRLSRSPSQASLVRSGQPEDDVPFFWPTLTVQPPPKAA